ncbi:hypothetical protein [Nitrospirillum sp. BR 11828]|nr:hypothetical protein [Nitrospirillum sp. BR 11828]MDZ5647337.1 hypothetical protein [Nitrospirillum sp. BR 11828]
MTDLTMTTATRTFSVHTGEPPGAWRPWPATCRCWRSPPCCRSPS